MIKSQEREFWGGDIPIKTQTCMHDQKPRTRIPGRGHTYKNTNLSNPIGDIAFFRGKTCFTVTGICKRKAKHWQTM
jgi:hypothetical protein